MNILFNFNFLKKNYINNKNLTKIYYSEHYKEIRQRLYLTLTIFLLISFLAFIYVKPITQILQIPAYDIKFVQLAPSEYFSITLKIAIYTSLIFCLPLFSIQSLLFLIPDVEKKRKNLILYLMFSALILFSLSLLFSFYILIPAVLQFFIIYNKNIIEPFWSFDKYYNFIIPLFYTTGIAFQFPILQVFFALRKFISGKSMFHFWKYILIGITIIAAILTPSTDPITQLLLTSALFCLYLGGSLVASLVIKDF